MATTPDLHEPPFESEPPVHSWCPLNLGTLSDAAAEQPTIGIGITYPGRVHLRSGEPESTKTLSAYIDAVLEIRAGRGAIVVDFEMGARLARSLFVDLGLDDFTGLDFIEPTEPMTDRAILSDVADLIQARKPSLVVIDSYSAALELHGCDPNKAADIQRFHRQVVEPFRAAGAAIVLIDHLTKNRETRGRFSIGSERKLAIVDCHLTFEAVRSLRRGGEGLIRVKTQKDRVGALLRPNAGELQLISDADTNAISWTLAEPDAAAAADDWRPTELMERVSNFLDLQTAPLSRNAIVQGVKGKREFVLKAIDCLIADEYAGETTSSRGGRSVRFLKRYQADRFSGSLLKEGEPGTSESAPVPGTSREPVGNQEPLDAGTEPELDFERTDNDIPF
jgi:hypothetical protein